MGQLIYVCSSNPGKLADFTLGLTDLDLKPLPRLNDIEPPEEDGHTFEQNASKKAAYYSEFTGQIVLADDSGIEVAALGGAPGVYSARFAGEGASDQRNNDLLLERLRGVDDRAARYVAALAIARSGRVVEVVQGSVCGRIVREPRGTGGFGYDPLFFYPPLNCCFAQLTAARRFQVSHRGNALRILAGILQLKTKSV